MRHVLLATALVASMPGMALAQSMLKPEEVLTFQLRARIIAVGGQAPDGRKFSVRFGVQGPTATAAGNKWCDWLKFKRPQVEATLKGYPAIYMRGYPVVVKLEFGGVADPTAVEGELEFEETEEVVKLSGELFGPSLGILIGRDEDKKPYAATMAMYNRRYWKVLEGAQVPDSERPKKFPIVDRFVGGDDDRRDWQEGIEQLSQAGFSVIMLPPSRPLRDILLKTGLGRTAWAVYNPPGYVFDFDPKITPESIAAWADEQARPYLDAGYAREDMALFAMSDEPGWYYPKMYQALIDSPAALARFHDYLRSQKLIPADLGATRWVDVRPIGRSQAKALPRRHLFYWTMRFFAHDSARHFAGCSRALEKALYAGVPVLTNWNFFSGRFYVPGPVGNNANKQSPDAAMGGHDWLEFGRLRGGTMLWTEDWFSDGKAYQWSFYCARLRCAAERGGVEFGGYVIPRAAGNHDDGILQKILCVVGSGGKAIQHFVFGPEYNWIPSSGYRDFAAKIAANESPRPQDRVYFSYNYFLPYIEQESLRRLGYQYARLRPTNYPSLRLPADGFEALLPRGPGSLLIADGTSNTVVVAYEYAFGLEKTFLDGNASIGIRLPIQNLVAETASQVLGRMMLPRMGWEVG